MRREAGKVASPPLGRRRCLVVLEPKQAVGKGFVGMALDQCEDPPQQLAKRQVIRDDDPSMMAPGGGVFLRPPNEVSHVERQDDSFLTGRKSKLIGI